MPRHPLRSTCLTLLALTGCGDDVDQPIVGPGLVVMRADAVGWKFDCNAYCPAASDADAVARRCPEVSEDETQLLANCTFHGGEHRAYVIADLADVPELSRDPTKTTFTATLTLDGDVAPVTTGKLGPLQSYPGMDSQYYVAGYLDLPADRTGVFRVRVASDEKPGFFAEAAEPLTLELPTITGRFTGCDVACVDKDCDCELAAGVGGIGVDVTVVPNFPMNLIRVRERLDGLLLRDEPWTKEMIRGTAQQKTFSLARVAPDRPGAIWSLSVGVGDESAATVTRRVGLRSLSALRLDVAPTTAEPNFTVGTPLKRARFEPDSECRALKVGVQSNDLAVGTPITLTTSHGELEGPSTSIVRPLGDAHELTTALALPTTIDLVGVATSLTVTASSVAQGAVARQIALQPVLPIQAAFSVATAKVVVGAAGNAGAVLKGVAVPPVGVPSFLPGVRLSVYVEASAIVGDPLKCGAPVAAEAVSCDPSQAGSIGGCLATPREVALAADGSFAVPIDAGLCFHGKLSVSVRGERYTEDVGCLGERKHAFEVLDTAEISFLPEP